MATFLKSLNSSLIDFIEKQQMFFVSTAASDGRINLSPKGLDSFRIIDNNTVLWLNYTGSGNETAAHILALNRITLMFCSFDDNPLILRLYGTAEALHPRDDKWQQSLDQFKMTKGVRNIFVVNIDSVQTSCGFGVPRYDFESQRERLHKWENKKDQNEIAEYWNKKNLVSIDGLPTGLK